MSEHVWQEQHDAYEEAYEAYRGWRYLHTIETSHSALGNVSLIVDWSARIASTKKLVAEEQAEGSRTPKVL